MDEEVKNIFATDLSLGEVETVFHNGLIANLEEVRNLYNSGERNIELHIVAQNGEAEFEKLYSDFAPNKGVEGQ